jgi:putative ABC transport system substrate-binding protein
VRPPVRLLIALVLGLVALLTPGAQAAPRIPRIGPVFSSPALPHYEAFKQDLRDLGYIEGRTIIIESRFWEGQIERLPDLVADLVRLEVDLMVTVPAPATRAAMNATTKIPIVFVGVGGDPVALGLVPNLARPGGNVTGFTHISNELSGKQIEILKEALPRFSRLAVLINPTNPNKDYWSRIEVQARTFGAKPYRLDVREPNELEPAFALMARQRPSALLVMPDPVFAIQRSRIMELAAKSRVPTMSWVREMVEAGGLMSYGANRRDQYRQAATYVDKILKGAKPGDLPVAQPTTFELVVNLRTAKALGLTIPPSLLVRADQVIE